MKTIYKALVGRLNTINIPYQQDWYRGLMKNALDAKVENEMIDALYESMDEAINKASLYWIDWDKGQLKKKDDTGRYPVAYPCALIRIAIPSTTDVTDTVQDCKATITITLAFDPLSMGRTAANAPAQVRAQGLEPYDVIADVYKLLQGFYTDEFSPLSRKSAGELTHPDLFVYQIVFSTEFEDSTAE